MFIKLLLFPVAELGGYLGMILGVSLLHLEHVFESIDKQSKIENACETCERCFNK